MGLPWDWIREIKEAFANGPPNGQLMGWDKDRFFNSLKEICEGCKVFNLTDFNYSYCNKYEIRPHSKDTTAVYELTLNVSFIVKAYSTHWTRLSLDLRRGSVVDESDVFVDVNPRNKIDEFMKKNDYIEAQDHWLGIRIDGVKLELADEAVLEKCIFDDYE